MSPRRWWLIFHTEFHRVSQSFILFITDYTDYFFVFYHMVNYKISGICGEKTSFYEAGSIVLSAKKRRISLFVLQRYNIL